MNESQSHQNIIKVFYENGVWHAQIGGPNGFMTHGDTHEKSLNLLILELQEKRWVFDREWKPWK